MKLIESPSTTVNITVTLTFKVETITKCKNVQNLRSLFYKNAIDFHINRELPQSLLQLGTL